MGEPAGDWEQLLGTGVQRKVIVEGEGDFPELGDLVLINWEGKRLLPSEETGSDVVFAKRTKVKVRIGDGDEIPGLELALRHMRTGQQCLVRCEARFAFGPDGCPATEVGDTDLPANSDVELLVDLIDVQSTVAASMNPEEQMAMWQWKKTVGNGHFSRQAFKKASRAYMSVLQAINDANFRPGSDLFEAARRLQIDCGNNLAIVYMRLGEPEKAKDVTVRVLELHPSNAKALLRAGSISLRQGNFAEAKLALQKALAVSPESKEIQAEISRLSARVNKYRTKKRVMQEMMGKSLFSTSGTEQRDSVAGDEVNMSVEAVDQANRDEHNGRHALKDTREAPTRRSVIVKNCRAVFDYSLVALAVLLAFIMYALVT